MQSLFNEKQLKELDKPLDKRFVSDRKGASGRKLKYLEGHDAIDQADRIFGYGNWGYETLSCEQTVIRDPMTGEAVGVCYKAKVRLDVRDCLPVIEVGSLFELSSRRAGECHRLQTHFFRSGDGVEYVW